MTITGNSLLAGTPVDGSDGDGFGLNPATGEKLDPAFGLVSREQLAEATAAAAAAFDTYRAISPEERATFLERIADNIEAVGRGTDRTRSRRDRPARCAARRRAGTHHRPAAPLRRRRPPGRPPPGPHRSRAAPAQAAPRGWTSASGTSRWARSRSSAPATSRWPSPPRAETPPPRSPRAAPSSSRPTTHIRGPRELVGAAIARAVADSGLPGGVFSLVFGAGSEHRPGPGGGSPASRPSASPARRPAASP